jgi:hypothetical protein
MKTTFNVGDVVWVKQPPAFHKWLAEISVVFGDNQYQIVCGPLRTTRFGWQLELAGIEEAMIWKLENA